MGDRGHSYQVEGDRKHPAPCSCLYRQEHTCTLMCRYPQHTLHTQTQRHSCPGLRESTLTPHTHMHAPSHTHTAHTQVRTNTKTPLTPTSGIHIYTPNVLGVCLSRRIKNLIRSRAESDTHPSRGMYFVIHTSEGYE